MTTIREIQDRVVLVDYYPGSHGHFLVTTLHSILYNNLKINKYIETNYHQSMLTPPAFWQGRNPDTSFLDYYVDKKTLDMFVGDKHIFWPSTWSLEWREDKSKILTDPYSQIGNIPIIEIYVTKTIWLRHYVNYWFNVGKYSHQQLSNNEFFTENFYEICNQINKLDIFETDKAKNITLVPDQYTFDQLDILQIIEEDIFINHGHSHKVENVACYRTLPDLNLKMPNKVFSIPMDNFYSFDLFEKTILDIVDVFKLLCDIDKTDLNAQWNKFISIQHPIAVTDSNVAVTDLTLVEQAYKNFLNKCK